MGAQNNTPERLEEKLDRIKQELNHVPTLPGVYLWKDASGEVIYVGKAKQLRARMRQYVNFQDERAKIPLLVEQIDSFDYVVVESEHESLVLENNLIKQYSPFFNADFKDDKSYPFIALTKGDVFPALKFTREQHVADTRYFGPYTNSRAARDLIDIARRIVPICSATCAQWKALKRSIDRNGQGRYREGSNISTVLRCAYRYRTRCLLRNDHSCRVRCKRQTSRALPVGTSYGIHR